MFRQGIIAALLTVSTTVTADWTFKQQVDPMTDTVTNYMWTANARSGIGNMVAEPIMVLFCNGNYNIILPTADINPLIHVKIRFNKQAPIIVWGVPYKNNMLQFSSVEDKQAISSIYAATSMVFQVETEYDTYTVSVDMKGFAKEYVNFQAACNKI